MLGLDMPGVELHSCAVVGGAASAAPAGIAADIVGIARQRLDSSAHREIQDLPCEFADGVLVLRGWVPTYHLKQLAQETVRHIRGVALIRNHVDVVSRVT